MFGESESESPQVPSPWDSLISLSTSPARSATPGTPPVVPRLVPEAEEGNVEYKLQLLSPSAARFARLVTQMKWRLLEGGGQAYYELGVADSGALVGLPRYELEQSLETLEMMAGEIGASVIVVKEIEVPAAISGLAAEDNDKWNRKRTRKKACISGEADPYEDDGGTTTETSTTESESDVLTDESPTIFPLEDSLDDAVPPMTLDRPRGPSFSIDLEISSVFKPRPFRTRLDGSGFQSPATDEGMLNNRDRRREKKQKSKQFMQSFVPAFDEPSNPTIAAHTMGGNRRMGRRMARDRRRDEKRQALLAYADKSLASLEEQQQNAPNGLSDDTAGVPPLQNTSIPVSHDATEGLVAVLETLHVDTEPGISPSTSPTDFVHISAPSRVAAVITSHSKPLDDSQDSDVDGDSSDLFPSPTPFSSALSNSIITIKGDSNGHQIDSVDTIDASNQPQIRMIVEALVVRKMSMEEAFLDFEGFQLI
ncbi:hypothetical protein BDV98DRAFT_654116 [Pterulicium gracile]|uniref:GTP-binding protein 2 n=1 Tax=Pterulicium gracile TaxID=1884261 RepID=A0A5C3QUP1_9AGAR|nr:hypothetical protein BDV98DRAFT_654116 [Pterula gracilis]